MLRLKGSVFGRTSTACFYQVKKYYIFSFPPLTYQANNTLCNERKQIKFNKMKHRNTFTWTFELLYICLQSFNVQLVSRADLRHVCRWNAKISDVCFSLSSSTAGLETSSHMTGPMLPDLKSAVLDLAPFFIASFSPFTLSIPIFSSNREALSTPRVYWCLSTSYFPLF